MVEHFITQKKLGVNVDNKLKLKVQTDRVRKKDKQLDLITETYYPITPVINAFMYVLNVYILQTIIYCCSVRGKEIKVFIFQKRISDINLNKSSKIIQLKISNG